MYLVLDIAGFCVADVELATSSSVYRDFTETRRQVTSSVPTRFAALAKCRALCSAAVNALRGRSGTSASQRRQRHPVDVARAATIGDQPVNDAVQKSAIMVPHMLIRHDIYMVPFPIPGIAIGDLRMRSIS